MDSINSILEGNRRHEIIIPFIKSLRIGDSIKINNTKGVVLFRTDYYNYCKTVYLLLFNSKKLSYFEDYEMKKINYSKIVLTEKKIFNE